MSYHEKYRISIFAGFVCSSADETVNIHDRVNNAQAPAHQMQSAAAPVGIRTSRMTGMDQHEQAIIAHETMTNGSRMRTRKWWKSSEDDGK
jgi:hypothetical protein